MDNETVLAYDYFNTSSPEDEVFKSNSKYQRIINVVAVAPVLFFGFFGNGMLTLIFLTETQNKTHCFKWSAYMLALAIFDFIFLSSTALPNALNNIFAFSGFPDQWLLWLHIISYASSASSTLVKMFFSLEQLMNIYLPYRLFNQHSFAKPLIEIAMAALLSTFHSVVWWINAPLPTNDHERHEVSVKKCRLYSQRTHNVELMCLTDFYLFFAFPFLVIMSASCLIVHRISKFGLDENLFQGVVETKQRIRRSSMRGHEIARRVTDILKDLPIVIDLQNSTRVLLASSTIFLISAPPFRLFTHALSLSDDFGQEEETQSTLNIWLENVFCWLWYANSAICPIAFYILSKRFRDSVSQKFMCCYYWTDKRRLARVQRQKYRRGGVISKNSMRVKRKESKLSNRTHKMPAISVVEVVGPDAASQSDHMSTFASNQNLDMVAAEAETSPAATYQSNSSIIS